MLTDPVGDRRGASVQQKCGVQFHSTYPTLESNADVTFQMVMWRDNSGWNDAARLVINSDKGTRYAY